MKIKINTPAAHMTVATGATIVSGIVAYLFFSKEISPAIFAIYGLCLTSGRVGLALLDSGIKVGLLSVLSKNPEKDLNPVYWLVLIFSCLFILIAAIFSLVFCKLFSWAYFDVFVVFAYATSYFATYPFILPGLVDKESTLNFSLIALCEAISNAIELILPVVASLIFGFNLIYLPIFAWTSKIIKIIFIGNFDFIKKIPRGSDFYDGKNLFKYSASMQASIYMNLFRDNMHVIFIGPIFGKEWLGYYSWVQGITSMLVQLFISAATRVSIPIMAKMSADADKVLYAKRKARFMASMIFPILASAYCLIPLLDKLLFNDKWAIAIEILPFALLRILSAATTTPAGSLVMLESGGVVYASTILKWTLMEISIFIFTINIFSEKSLAYTWAFGGWIGAYLMVKSVSKVFGGKFDKVALPSLRSTIISFLIIFIGNWIVK